MNDHQYLLFAKSVLQECPQFLTEEMMGALVKAGVDLPADVLAKFPNQNHPKAEALRFPMNDP